MISSKLLFRSSYCLLNKRILSTQKANVAVCYLPSKKFCRLKSWSAFIRQKLSQSIKRNSSRACALGFTGIYAIAFFKHHSIALCDPTKSKSYVRQCDDKQSDKESKFDWNHFFWVLLWPDIILLVGAIVSALVVAVTNIKIPLLLGDVVNAIASVLEKGSENSLFAAIQKPAIRIAFLYGVQGIFTFSYISILSALGENVAARFRSLLFSSIIKQDVAFFDTHSTGEIVNRLSTDVQDFKSAFKSCISQGIRNMAQTTGSIVILFIISPKMTVFLSIVLPVMVGCGTIIGSGLRKLSHAAHAQVEKAISIADEAIGNMRTVRAFAMENKELCLFEEEIKKSASLNKDLGFGIGAFQGLSNVALNGIVLMVLCLGGELVQSNELSKGELMSFLVASQSIQRSLAQLSQLLGHYIRGVSAGGRIYEFIHRKPTISLRGGHRIPYHSLLGNVEFRNVSFSYPSRPEQTVLKDFSLYIPCGHMVALCGVSGGGKSTVAVLLERFYDVDCGGIYLDNWNIQNLDPSWLRGQVIGFINQEPVLFATSIMENIRYGCPSATDEEVFEAAKQANAHNFILSFPHGYQTVLGERGVTISGGQKQRIAIARALIKKPSILVLDEATSALDAESEKIVQETLDEVVKGRTVLVIAHRLSTIQNADIIAVVAGGSIAEMGTHEELKRRRGLYWELIKHQEDTEVINKKFKGA